MKNLFFLLLTIFSVSSITAQEVGIASYYGPGLQGNLTASGEVFDKNLYTAAHPTLPFGTYVKVTNTENNRSVTVKINDRGPYTGDRIIDLAEAAAALIGITAKNGIAEVRVDPIGMIDDSLPGSPASTPAPAPTPPTSSPVPSPAAPAATPSAQPLPIPAGSFGVQVGAFSSLGAAQLHAGQLMGMGYNNVMVKQKAGGTTPFKVIVGPFSSRSAADSAKLTLRQNRQIDCFVVGF